MKYYGHIGYGRTVEVRPGIWEPVIEERACYGDITRSGWRSSSGDKVNDDFTINNEFSIIADPYAFENCAFIRYLTFGGARWTVSSVEIQYPRMILTVGGVYNG